MIYLRNKTAALGLILNVCFSAYAIAGSVGAASNQKAGFGASITGLYLQPDADNLVYGIYTNPLPLPAPSWYQKSVSPDYNGAFELGLQYNFAKRQDEAQLNWLHLGSTDSAGFAPTQVGTSVGPTYYFGPLEQFLLNTSAKSTVKFNIDNVNLIFGHKIDLTDEIMIEPSFGIDFVGLKENITNRFYGTDPILGPYYHYTYTKSSFNGVGPRLKMNASYALINHFGINAEMASSIFAGQLKTSTNFTSWTAAMGSVPHNNTPADTTLSNRQRTKVVPELDAKLSLFYATELTSNIGLNLQLGYMFTDYLNSISHVLPASLVPGSWESGTVALESQNYQRSDFSMNGPYIKCSILSL